MDDMTPMERVVVAEHERRQAVQRAEQAEGERDHWKREHDEVAEKWAVLGERTLVASALLAEAPPDVEAELAPQRYDLLRKVLAGEAGRDDMVANLVPKLAEAERRRDEQAEAEVERLKESRGFWRKLTAKREAERDALKAATDRVRAEHTHGRQSNICRECGVSWPCSTIAALDHPPDKEPEEDDQWRRDEREIDGGFSGCELPRLWPPRRRHHPDTTGETP